MCVLLLLHRFHPEFALIVGANRDEDLDRSFSPPTVWTPRAPGPRILYPKDKRAGGTWLGINGAGLLAGIVNRSEVPMVEGRETRGTLPLAALRNATVPDALAAVRSDLARSPRNGFRLLIADAQQAWLFEGDGSRVHLREISGDVVVMTNEWGPDAAIDAATRVRFAPAAGDRDVLLAGVAGFLRDDGAGGGHPYLKSPVRRDGREYGTVSSIVIAVSAVDVTRSLWQFAPGRPDVTPYRDYRNLLGRLTG